MGMGSRRAVEAIHPPTEASFDNRGFGARRKQKAAAGTSTVVGCSDPRPKTQTAVHITSDEISPSGQPYSSCSYYTLSPTQSGIRYDFRQHF